MFSLYSIKVSHLLRVLHGPPVLCDEVLRRDARVLSRIVRLQQIRQLVAQARPRVDLAPVDLVLEAPADTGGAAVVFSESIQRQVNQLTLC